MSGSRKLQTEVDKTLKKISEGVELFDEIWEKVYAAQTQSQKEKYELELKKEIKKLQRLRDQLKTWAAGSDVKNKQPLLDARRLIETKMEAFKVCEKETKTKAYSKDGLAAAAKLDPEAIERNKTRDWIQECLNTFNEQIESLEADVESLSSGKGSRTNKVEIEEKEELITRHRWHVGKLEAVTRLVDNEQLAVEPVNDIREDIEYYLEAALEDPDFMETQGDDDPYEVLDMDSITAKTKVSSGSGGAAAAASAADDSASKVGGKDSSTKKEPKKAAASAVGIDSMLSGVGKKGGKKSSDPASALGGLGTKGSSSDGIPTAFGKMPSSKMPSTSKVRPCCTALKP